MCAGAWRRTTARPGEKIRQALDASTARHHASFTRLTDLLHALASRRHGPPPASVIVLSGDVHHAHLAEASFPTRAPIESAVVHAVCSPLRNPLDRAERRAPRAALSRSIAAITRPRGRTVQAALHLLTRPSGPLSARLGSPRRAPGLRSRRRVVGGSRRR